MGKVENRGNFKSGRIWKEPRAPAGIRIRSKSLRTSWTTKMSLKASMQQIKRTEQSMKLVTQEQRLTELKRLAARKKQKEENRMKSIISKTPKSYIKKKVRNSFKK